MDCNHEPCNWIVTWPDGTHCWLDDLEEYLLFMSDDYDIKAVSDYEIKDYVVYM